MNYNYNIFLVLLNFVQKIFRSKFFTFANKELCINQNKKQQKKKQKPGKAFDEKSG